MAGRKEATDMDRSVGSIKSIVKSDTYYIIKYLTGELAKINILNSHVFRYHLSRNGEFHEYPTPDNPNAKAKITVKTTEDYGFDEFKNSTLTENASTFNIDVAKITIKFNKLDATMLVIDKRNEKVVLVESQPLSYNEKQTVQTLNQNEDEFFFGGGMQNGRFTHKGEKIEIINNNHWNDGGVTSPCPFYWSTYGYGVLRNTWQKGIYDFSDETRNTTVNIHNDPEFDAFYFINAQPKDILNDYYELTGQPILLPEYAFYQAHLNAFNRDYWVQVPKGTQNAILYEDGYYYRCYQPNEIGDKHGILESLNGEKNNYQFSARAMIDRYKKHDLPLGWFVPNDGYGSGYGQTDSLDGDILNLKAFGDYARENGVELAVWTESNLHPVDPEHPKKGERDLHKEVSIAGVVALKADVAWIGHGYSFGLDAMQKASDTFLKAANDTVRPMIITVDGWAGTQRCAGVWSGDQSGGEWEYIRFHIPTYIGAGLSGQPNVGSDMDGIFRGGDRKVNIRDFQWKTFTPLQLNMDGWGSIQKTPFAFDKEATDINRAYLKLKSMLLPYNYTISHESIHGLPMIRAMFLEFPKEVKAYTKASQYQFMWGPNLLIAPIYDKKEDNHGNSIRNNIYLPSKEIWIDYLTGEKYKGGKIYHSYKSPLWKIPIFVRDGAIIPQCNQNNNPNEVNRDQRIFYIYPNGHSSFELYEDDGISRDYLEKQYSITKINVHAPTSNSEGDLHINVAKTEGVHEGIVVDRTTQFFIMSSNDIEHIKVAINNEPVRLEKVHSRDEYNSKDNVYYFDRKFVTNPYLLKYDKKLHQSFLMIKIAAINVLENDIHMKIKGFANISEVIGSEENVLDSIKQISDIQEREVSSNSVTIQWNKVNGAIGYEVQHDRDLHHVINDNNITVENLTCNSKQGFKIRTVTENGVSEWSNVIYVKTKENPYKHVIENVKAICNLPSQPNQEIENLTSCDLSKIWHTNWGAKGKMDARKGIYLKLNFELNELYDVEKVEYIPRDDAGNGTFLKIQFRTSNGETWSDWSQDLVWAPDSSPKTISLDRKMKYMEIIVRQSIGDFGSARALLFYKKL